MYILRHYFPLSPSFTLLLFYSSSFLLLLLLLLQLLRSLPQVCNGVLRPPIRDEWKEPDSDEAKLVEIMVICWAQKPEDRPDLEDVLELLDDIIGRRRRRRMEERGEGGNGVGGHAAVGVGAGRRTAACRV